MMQSPSIEEVSSDAVPILPTLVVLDAAQEAKRQALPSLFALCGTQNVHATHNRALSPYREFPAADRVGTGALIFFEPSRDADPETRPYNLADLREMARNIAAVDFQNRRWQDARMANASWYRERLGEDLCSTVQAEMVRRQVIRLCGGFAEEGEAGPTSADLGLRTPADRRSLQAVPLRMEETSIEVRLSLDAVSRDFLDLLFLGIAFVMLVAVCFLLAERTRKSVDEAYPTPTAAQTAQQS